MSKMAPLAPFYEIPLDTRVLRLCFCKDDSTLEKPQRFSVAYNYQ